MLTFPEQPFQCLFTLAYKELKPLKKKKKIGTLQNALMQLFLYLVRVGLVSL